mmetsp:Transcript_5125/g.7822  ORF Transcript_5125/g.7822 Transcript_5125/m.7822 type:complete len:87 (+) Transcript_5125:1560-1820(+)
MPVAKYSLNRSPNPIEKRNATTQQKRRSLSKRANISNLVNTSNQSRHKSSEHQRGRMEPVKRSGEEPVYKNIDYRQQKYGGSLQKN